MKNVLIGLAALISATASHAAIIPTLVGSPVAEGSYFRYNYDVYLNPLSSVQKGDGFTIFDFAGFVPGSNTQPGGSSGLVSFSFDPFGPAYFAQMLPAGADDPAITNLTWSYQGDTPYNATPPSDPSNPGGDLYLGRVSALSIYDQVAMDYTSSGFHKNTTGGLGGETTDVQVPLAVPVPEPGMIGLFGLGLLGLAGARRRKS